MCGIAGVIFKKKPVEDPAFIIKSMLKPITHRGPDDDGIYVDNNVALGHKRLAILDLTAAGKQPMVYKNFVIVFNGEIYNYLELREALKKLGHVFHTQTDTEVLLHAYEEWNDDCLHKLEGMWAFAIYDQNQESLFCSRDRFGIKPFYYYQNDSGFYFGSEIKAILAIGLHSSVNYESLLSYLVAGYQNHTKGTFFNDIFQLIPGEQAKIAFKYNQQEFKYYYDLKSISLGTKNSTDYESCLRRTIALHLRSDVPVGTCLSGGLDSSTIAALASETFRKELVDRRFGAITASSESLENDESVYANSVAKHCNLEWHVTMPSYEDFSAHIEECLLAQGEPVGGPSVFMQYWVMKKAKALGFKVMLDGQGGDETLLGYERYYPAIYCEILKRGNLRELACEFINTIRNSKLSLIGLIAYSAYFLFSPLRKRVLAKRMYFLKRRALQIGLNELPKQAKCYFDIKELQYAEIMRTQLPNLLHYEDHNSMAHSIEARVPLVDHHCIETAIAIPPREKIYKGFTKYALRRIADKLLPSEIAWRKNKIGFEAPVSVWLTKHQGIMQQEVSSSAILKSITKKIPPLHKLTRDIQWRLYNIALWEKQYHVDK